MQAAHHRERLSDRQAGQVKLGRYNVVEADDRDVARDAKPDLMQRADGSDCRRMVEAGERREVARDVGQRFASS